MRTEEILDMLGGLLEELSIRVDYSDDDHALTEEFLEEWHRENFSEAMEWIFNHGGCCSDFEVIVNIGGSEQGLLAQLWQLTSKDSHKAVLIEKLFDLAEKSNE